MGNSSKVRRVVIAREENIEIQFRKEKSISGFGDSDQDDNSLIDEMMSVLKGTLHGANAIVLLVNGQQQRINASIQQMLREMQV